VPIFVPATYRVKRSHRPLVIVLHPQHSPHDRSERNAASHSLPPEVLGALRMGPGIPRSPSCVWEPTTLASAQASAHDKVASQHSSKRLGRVPPVMRATPEALYHHDVLTSVATSDPLLSSSWQIDIASRAAPKGSGDALTSIEAC
jgi:hypothetical protein